MTPHLKTDKEEEDRITLSHHTYQAVFEDHNHKEGIVVNPRPVLRMRIERNEATWSVLQFESKA